MALVLKDRVKETSTTTGTGSFTLGGTSTGFQSFSVVGDGNTTYYGIVNSVAGEWEIGVGTYTASGTVLSRDTILESSNGGSAVNFSAGTKDVFATYPAEKAVSTDTLAYPPDIGSTTPAAGTFTTLTATGNAAYPFVRINNASQVARVYAFTPSGVGALMLSSAGSGSIRFMTSTITYEQFRVSHTGSAVNYVQVTGAATGSSPAITAQGSDSTLNLTLGSKGSGSSVLFQANGLNAFQVSGTGTVVNRLRASASIAGASPVFDVVGSDTNISQVFQSKGTGAIDLAAGSSGVNISNGGTVTAITRTAQGSGYTSIPSVVITAPTTAGGVQATAIVAVQPNNFSIVSGGTGYSLNDVLTFVGGTVGSQSTQLTVTGVSGGVITSATQSRFGRYYALPSNPVSVTGGTGTGATFNVVDSVVTTEFTITNAGSGYVEQPTVTFSGGGGSGAAAYATVGSATVVKSIGTNLSFVTPAGEQVRIVDPAGTPTSFVNLRGGAGGCSIFTDGSSSELGISSHGGFNIRFFTNGRSNTEQLRVTHTASAVNYVQVTGAATGSRPTISAQGSDTNLGLDIATKGNRSVTLRTNSVIAFDALSPASGVNYLSVVGSVASSAPSLQSTGSDTNIDLTLTPKGTGNVRFGTYTGTALSIAGYIEIKDAGGTIRKLAVVA